VLERELSFTSRADRNFAIQTKIGRATAAGTRATVALTMKLTARMAQSAIAAATAEAAAIEVPMNIAILDAGGHLKSFMRMDGAVLGSIDIAMKKARTAVLFQTNSETVWEYCKPGAPAHGLELTNDVLITFAGGIPIRAADGEILGAIGVSGGAVPQDARVAAAGAAAASVSNPAEKQE